MQSKRYLIVGGSIEAEGKVITERQYQKLRQKGIYPLIFEVNDWLIIMLGALINGLFTFGMDWLIIFHYVVLSSFVIVGQIMESNLMEFMIKSFMTQKIG